METDNSGSIPVADNCFEADPLLFQEILNLKCIFEAKKERLTKECLSGLPASDLGFFSQPFRIRHGERDFIVKLYPSVKDFKLVSELLKNHDEYVMVMKKAGIRIPATIMLSRHDGKKHQIVIIQEAFRNEELIRNRIIGASEGELPYLCSLIFDDIIRFWRSKPPDLQIGFHPTLRNYAIRNGRLSYFDTFPPMIFCQKDLNRIILYWSPFGGWVKKIVPLKLINRVSDEYYCLIKMFSGVVGSCCRLRPDDNEKILGFSREYVSRSEQLTAIEKEGLNSMLATPPRLPFIWLFIRLLSGNKGKPNI